MKKRVAIPIIVTASVVAALFIAVLVLSLVSVNPLLKVAGDYDGVAVYKPDATYAYPNTEKSSEELEKGFEGTKFSVMHAILEGRFNYSPKFKTVKNDEGKKERVTLSVTEIITLFPGADNYMLEFTYDELRTVKVQGEEISFDVLKVMVYETEGEIERIELYPYEYSKISTVNDERYHYEIDVVEVWSTTSKLMNVLTDYDNLVK